MKKSITVLFLFVLFGLFVSCATTVISRYYEPNTAPLAAQNETEAQVIVSRLDNDGGDIAIYIDKQYAGKLGNGQTGMYKVTTGGPHNITAKYDMNLRWGDGGWWNGVETDPIGFSIDNNTSLFYVKYLKDKTGDRYPSKSFYVELFTTSDFERATLTIANKVSDLLAYDNEYYDKHSIALRSWSEERDPIVKEELWIKLQEVKKQNPEINSLKHALDTGITVCGGYSKLFYKIAQEAGYDVYYIETGFMGSHAYNAILFEDTWYFFDTTWYDTGNRSNKWLWSREIWNDWEHTFDMKIFKLGDNYENDRDATLIATGKNIFDQSEDGFKVKQKGEMVSITGYTGKAASVVIPATIWGKPVGEIGDHAFDGTGITSISIPESVISIGKYAFFNCGLTSISIPANVTSIGDSAFFGCRRLTSISIPANVTSIGKSVFATCYNLADIAVDPRNVFYTSRDGVLFDKTVTTLIQYAYGRKEEQYVIPASVTRIEALAFDRCSLTSISIPSNVTSIGKQAFLRCRNLTSISIGSGVTNIESFVFQDCYVLANIAVDPRNTSYTSRDGVLFDKTASTLIEYPEGKQGQYAIPTSVTSIGAWAFSNCTGLTSVSIPTSVTSIGDGAFSGCTGISSINIPESVISIGKFAFSDSKYLTAIRIGANVSMGERSFGNGFIDYYRDSKKKAGAYIFRNGAWSYSEQ